MSTRPLGTGETAAIEGLGTRTNVASEEGRFLLADYGWEGRSNRRPHIPSFHSARVSAPTQIFALMFETHQTGAHPVEALGPGAFSQFLARATALYEMSAKIIAGTHEKRGETLNRFF